MLIKQRWIKKRNWKKVSLASVSTA